MIERVRRIVMGEDPASGAVRTDVEAVEPVVMEKLKVWFVWGWDRIPKLPPRRRDSYSPRSWFPAVEGMRVISLSIGGENDVTSEQARRAEELIASLHAAEPAGVIEDADRPGMHRSDTIDIGVVVSGRVEVEADDGTKTVLGPGDVYVQNGAMHKWEFPDEVAHIVFVILGAER